MERRILTGNLSRGISLVQRKRKDKEEEEYRCNNNQKDILKKLSLF